MNESQKRTTQSGKKGEKISHGNKLKNEASAGASMRRKFRHGKKNNSLTKEEAAREKKLQNQGRKKAFAQTVSIGAVRREIVRNEDENVGTQSMESVLGTSETILYETKKNHYSKKMHEKKRQEEYAKEDGTKHSGSYSSSRNAQKKRIKKEYEAAARKKQAEKTADKVGNISQKVVDKTEEIAGTIAKTVAEHPMECLIAVAVLIVVLIVAGSLSSCSAITGGLGNMTLTTSCSTKSP